MKRLLSISLIVVLCLVLITSVAFFVYSIVDINRIMNELSNDPSASGIDYFGVGWEYGIGLFALSVFGLILSVISKKLLKQNNLQYISIIGIVGFVILLIASFFLFY